MMIIVSGLPGAGKSYLASRLSKETSACYISSYLTRKERDARGEYAFEDTLTVYEEMAKRAGEHLRRGENVVIDATFYRHEMRDLFLTLAKLLYTQVCYIEVVASEEVIRERLSQPRLHGDADMSAYELVKPQYEKPEIDHLVLESTNDNINDMLRLAQQYARKIKERS